MSMDDLRVFDTAGSGIAGSPVFVPSRQMRRFLARSATKAGRRERANRAATDAKLGFVKTLYGAGVPADFIRESLGGRAVTSKSAAAILAAWPAEKARRDRVKAKAASESTEAES